MTQATQAQIIKDILPLVVVWIQATHPCLISLLPLLSPIDPHQGPLAQWIAKNVVVVVKHRLQLILSINKRLEHLALSNAHSAQTRLLPNMTGSVMKNKGT